MDLQELEILLDYHYWARDRVLDAAAQLAPEQFTQDVVSSFRSVRDTLAHVYFAEWIWSLALAGHLAVGRLPPRTSSPTSPRSRRRGRRMSRGCARSSAAWEIRVWTAGSSTTTLGGQSGNSLFKHMLQHVVNHASYHRGQVTTMLRQLGAAPPKSMDMIAFYREVEAGTRRREG